MNKYMNLKVSYPYVGYTAPFFDPIFLDLNQKYKIAFGTDEYVLLPRSPNGNSKLKMFRNGFIKHGYCVKDLGIGNLLNH